MVPASNCMHSDAGMRAMLLHRNPRCSLFTAVMPSHHQSRNPVKTRKDSDRTSNSAMPSSSSPHVPVPAASLATAPVVVVSTRACPYCKRAKDTLTGANIVWANLDVSVDAGLRSLIKDATGSRTVPQVPFMRATRNSRACVCVCGPCMHSVACSCAVLGYTAIVRT